MRKFRWSWLIRILAGGLLGLIGSVVLASHVVGARGPSPVTCLLCTALGIAAGAATLPFADDGRTLLLPVAGLSSGLSLGKRQGVCPLYPAACFLGYVPMVFLLSNYTAMFHCSMVAVPALAGNVSGWLCRRTASEKR